MSQFVKLDYDLIRQRGFSLQDKIIWAYIQGFPVFNAKNSTIARVLGISPAAVKQALWRLRKATGTKGGAFVRSKTIPERVTGVIPTVTPEIPTVTPEIPQRNTRDTFPIGPLDKVLDNTLDSCYIAEIGSNGGVEKKENDEAVAAPPKPAGCPLAAREANKALALGAIRRARRNSALESRESLA